MKFKVVLFLIIMIQMGFLQKTFSQVKCRTSEVNGVYFQNNAAAQKEYKGFNKKSKSKI